MMPLNLKLGFVFVNYNNSLTTIKLIDSLKRQNTDIYFPIIIVDNLSNNENINILRLIQEDEVNVKIIFSEINLGYFRGLNCGIGFINENYKDVNCIVVGNNDLIFPNNFVNSIFNKIQLFNEFPVISPNIITDDGFHQNPHVIKKISFIREIVYDIYYSNHLLANLIGYLSKFSKIITDRADETEHDKAQLIYQGHGSCYILGPLFLNNFKELFAPTFLFGEEFFLTIQLRKKSYQVYYEPSIKITHECHSSIGKMPSKKMWQIAKDSHKEYRKYIKLTKFYKL